MMQLEKKKDNSKGGLLYGMRGKRIFVLMLAMACSLILVLGWEGCPASTVLGNRGWRPTLRLELEIAAQRDSPLNQVYRQEEEVFTRGRCDYSRGKWVKDSRNKPLYSGRKCKQWLSGMWACRLSDRKDFEYEKYRWQPHECDMPSFDSSSFLSRMREKTISFVGDSLGRQQFQSLLCMLSGGEDEALSVTDVGEEFGFVAKPHWSSRPNGWAYRFDDTNTTIIYHWSATLCDIRPYNASDPNTASAMHIDMPPLFLQKFINRIDVVVLNTGHHWNFGKINGNRYEMHAAGTKLRKKKPSISAAHRFAVESVVRWLDAQIIIRQDMTHQRPLRGFLTALSPRHFMNGDWDSGGRCDKTRPDIDEGRFSRDLLAERTIAGTSVELLNITYLSQFRAEAHISKYNSLSNKQGIQDCLHWCLPGVPDVWNEIFNAQLLEEPCKF